MKIHPIQVLMALPLAAVLVGCSLPAASGEAGASGLVETPPLRTEPASTADISAPSTAQPAAAPATTASPQALEPFTVPQQPPTASSIAFQPIAGTADLTDPPLSSWEDLVCSPLEFVDIKDLPKVVSDKYNPPPMGSDARHQGTDFCYYQWKGHGLLEGTQVRAVFSGKVAASEVDTFPFGNLVILETPASGLPGEVRSVFGIDPEESLYVLYAHLGPGSPFVRLGAQVSRCENLGIVGHTGNADASHLHLEMRVGLSGRVFDGFSAFQEDDTPREKQNYQIWRTSGEFLHFDPLRLLLFQYSHGATATPTPKKFP